jgi:hypothetical protein
VTKVLGNDRTCGGIFLPDLAAMTCHRGKSAVLARDPRWESNADD